MADEKTTDMNPYIGIPNRQFWRKGVSEAHILTVKDMWRKKFEISATDVIASAGSCFAQHISRRLAKRGFNFLDVEPAPSTLPNAVHQKYGYATYSARYGNIYTSVQMLQLAQEALGLSPSLPYSWEKNGRFYDPLRPSVEPEGLRSHDEVQHHRKFHLQQVKLLLETCDIFIFTLGLTEAWRCKRTGRILPTAPGVIAGSYDPNSHEFVNLSYEEVKSAYVDFMAVVNSLRPHNPCRFLLSVSPVPLTATATDDHVLPATTYSKSVLRAVAGELCATDPMIDYFPSYEVISSPWSRGFFYEPNLRSVSSAGVDAAMRIFFLEHGDAAPVGDITDQTVRLEMPNDDGDGDGDGDGVVCEEILLESFSR